MTFEYPDSIKSAAKFLGRPYQYGGKWLGSADDKPNPSAVPYGPIDCSGLSRYILALDGVRLPDGAQNQIKVCAKLPASLQADPPARALGFFDPEGSPDLVDHVLIAMGAGVVIEARGNPYNCVICRPVAAWLAQPGFLGFYAPPGLGLESAAPGTP